MIYGLRIGLRGLSHLFAHSYVYIWGNIAWLLLSLLIVTAPAAWAGLTRLGYHMHRHPTAEFDQFWQGFRANLRLTLLLAIIGFILVFINVSNLFVYRFATGWEATALRAFWIAALLIWFAPQLYVFPILHAMEQPSLRGAYRNAFVMMLLNPLFTLGVWAVAALVIAFSVLFPIAWFLITGGALAAIGNTAVQDRLRAAGFEKEQPPTTLEPDVYWDGVS